MKQFSSAYDLIFKEWADRLSSLNLPKFRSKQIWEGLYHNLWQSSQEFSNLPLTLRDQLFIDLPIQTLEPIKQLKSSDGETTKVLFKLASDKLIETVLMNYDTRNTVCISTQSGCAMGCVFCATGQMGFQQNLTSGEIIEQILFFERFLRQKGDNLTNVVFMGMGEPLHNYENTLKAIRILNDPTGFNFGARRFTLSTVGLVPMIEKLATENTQVNLAISLHAANNELRSSMLPINKKYPLETLIQACRKYINKTHRRLTFEYALVDGVNDSPIDAKELTELIKRILCHVNLIPLNPTKKYAKTGSSRERAAAFKATLDEVGIPCTIRMRRGIDIQAGCGQLATSESRSAA